MNLKNITIIVILVIIEVNSAAFAENNELTLNDAITISLNNNNRYKIAREKVYEKDEKVKEIWGELWPELGTGVSRTWYGADRGVLTQSEGQSDLRLVTGKLSVNPGNFYGKLKSSREEHIISVHDARKIKVETTVNTIQLYYKVLLAQDIVKLRTDSVKALEENQRIVSAAYQEGALTKLVYLRAQVAAANEKTILINARKDYERAKAGFNIQLGKEIDSAVVLDAGSLALDGSKDSGIVYMMEKDRISQYGELVTVAIKNRPELMMLRHKKNLLKYRGMESDSIYLWPTFFITGSYGATKLINPVTNINTGYPDPTLDLALNSMNKTLNPEGWNKNWNFSVGAMYRWGALSPLDPSGARSRQLKSMSSQTDMEIEDFIRCIKLEIKEGLLELEAASNAYLSQKENLKSAEESLRVAALQFRNGMIDNTILLNANVELSSARAMYVQSLFDFQTAKAKLNQSIGYDFYIF